jgi:hypothetical protein
MSSVVIAGDTSGSVTLQAPAVAGSTTLTLPSTSGTLITSTGMTLVSTLTASSSASLEWTGLTGANTYMLVLNTIQASTNQTVTILFGTGAGPTYLTTGYAGGSVYYSTPGGGLNGAPTTSVYIPLHQVGGNTAPVSGSFFLTGMLGNKPAATGTAYGGVATDSVSTIAASLTTTGPITAVKVLMNTGNLTSGTASLYKLAA